MSGRESLARAPTLRERYGDLLFRGLARCSAVAVVAMLALLVLELGLSAWPAIREHGVTLFMTSVWDPSAGVFGVLPEIWGTLYTSGLALVIGGSLGVAIAVFLSEGMLPRPLALFVGRVVELLAAIPSVVYGLWGVFVIIPLVRPVSEALHGALGFVPLFASPLYGPGILPASLVLAIMILPTVAAVSLDALRAVPLRMREAALGMGATRWEAIGHVILPAAKRSIFGALVLALGRALGETMALAMLVGNVGQITLSLFSPANTLAALLALNFPEAGEEEVAALMYAALVLLAITLAVNLAGAALVRDAAGEARR
ncbi:MAG: phosphate ABC transporter permease subunit PstC [Pseudomonadales bacterium]|nr:phosphate ABC transporter permease subunit PstC [Pseudomonadales bacterium]